MSQNTAEGQLLSKLEEVSLPYYVLRDSAFHDCSFYKSSLNTGNYKEIAKVIAINRSLVFGYHLL